MLYFRVSLIIACINALLADDCSSSQYCKALSWRAWGNCEGTCGKQTTQTRRRLLCFEVGKIAPPITREKVLTYCNITQPTAETRACRHCLNGKFNTTSNACEKCDSDIARPAAASPYKSFGMILGFSVLGVICVVTAVVIIVCCLCCPSICSCTKRDEKEDDNNVRNRHTTHRTNPIC